GDLEEGLAAVQRDRAASVELEEVDGLADVAVGLGPGLGALADLERGELGAARAHPGGCLDEDLGPACRGGPRPLGEPGCGGSDRLIDLGARGPGTEGDGAVGPAGIL